MPKVLSRAQVDAFWRDGVLTVPDAVTPDQLARLNADLAGWVEESRAHSAPFGAPTLDDRPRFDMGAEHTPEHPALRRVNNPSDISDAYLEVMADARTVDMIADLLGPNLKFHHCKINVKLPGARTEVAYHQDFAYTPHTNDDVLAVGVMLDDRTPENGPLLLIPGSHTGPTYDHHIESDMLARQIPVTGKAGSVCLMHTRLAHGSAANRSERPRGLYICVYTAADAVPIARNPMPNPNEGRIARGAASPPARMIPLEVELPKQPKSASFFTVQGQASAAAE